jgi:hypothetical protein
MSNSAEAVEPAREAYSQGQLAHQCLIPFACNPYSSSTQEHVQWALGWESVSKFADDEGAE